MRLNQIQRMRKITGISLLIILLASSCSSIKQFRYMSKGKAPKGTFRTEIPFELNNGLIVIKVKLNGSDKEYEFMLDSGAPVSVIYQEAYADSKLEIVMNYNVSDSQGNSTKSDYVMLDVAIGNSEFKDIFTAYSPKVSEHVFCIANGGIIGADLMQTANWQIDFEHKKIIISDRKKSSLPDLKDYQKISFSKRSPFSKMPWLNVVPGLTVDLKVNGKRFKDVLLDSGSSGAVTLPKNAVTDTLFKKDLKEVLIGYTTFGLLGAQMDTSFYLKSSDISVEKMNLNKHTIHLAKNNSSLIGNKIFSEYAMVIDFRKQNLYLKPIVQETKTADKKEFGCYLIYDSKSSNFRVSSIYEGSQVALAGVQVNDTVIEINGQKIPVLSSSCEYIDWQRKLHTQDLLLIKTTKSDEVIRIEKGIIPRR